MTRRLFTVRRVLAIAAVVLATLGAGLGALAIFAQDKQLSIGTVRLSVDPFHRGALDIYVPVVDWGARFHAIRLPARLHVDLRAVDRDAVQRLAAGGQVDVDDVRKEARDALARFIRVLLLVIFASALAAGALAAVAVRGGATPKLHVTLTIAAVTALGGTVAVGLLLPPRGRIDEPQYYAYGPDIPRALEALEAARRSGRQLDQELNAQLVGVAQLVTRPGARRSLANVPRLTLASDLHNNLLGLPILERAARGGPVFFAGDLTDRGSRFETRLVRRVVRAGKPLVFVSGNHDSDSLSRRLVRDGAIVLHQDGRIDRDGDHGDVIVNVRGLRVAGYADPFERRASEDFADRFRPDPGPERRREFAAWFETVKNDADVVMLHDERLAEFALAGLQREPPSEPLVFLVGHTHRAALRRVGPVTILNGGSIGAGGTGNLGEGTPIGLAVLLYESAGGFAPLAADLVEVDPATGSSTARRERLDFPQAPGRGA